MQRGFRRWAVGLVAAGLTIWTAVADPQWDLPAALPEGFLPKLGAVTADGDLGEWSAAAAVPLRFASYIAHRKPSHTWNGPTDCGMEVFCGWTFEVVLPWSAFPGFHAGAGSCLGLQFGLDDYDGRDNGLIQPLMMSWQAATLLFMSPQKMVKWALEDSFPKGAGTPIGTVAGIDLPSEIYA